MAITFVDGVGAYVTGDPCTVAAPAGIQDGDILLMAAETASANTSLTWPSGFTQISYGDQYTFLAWKRCSSESGTYAVSAPTGSVRVASILAFRGCVTSGTPYTHLSDTGYTTNDTILRAAGFTTAEVTTLAWFGVYYAAVALTEPSGFTVGETTPNTSYRLYSCYKIGQAAGPTGNIDGTLASNVQYKHALMIDLLPASEAVTFCPQVIVI